MNALRGAHRNSVAHDREANLALNERVGQEASRFKKERQTDV
jgi:hypothetical protein